MKKISVGNIVKFRTKSAASQLTFIRNLGKPKEQSSEGGDYWTTSISAISNVFKSDNKNLIYEKVDELNAKFQKASAKISKDMFKRNIDILHKAGDFDFSVLKPDLTLTFLSRKNVQSIIDIKGVPVQVRPQHVFSYVEGDKKRIGAVWFVSKLGGFASGELGIFTDAIYCYLSANYSDKFQLDMKYCIAMDVASLDLVRYSQLHNKEVVSLLDATLESILKVLSR